MHMGRDELVHVAFDVFMLSGVVEEMGIGEATLSGFLSAVASHYHEPTAVPYHNLSHAVQVLHTAWLVRRGCGWVGDGWVGGCGLGGVGGLLHFPL